MKKGFTLVELLAVIVILAAVSVIVFPAITTFVTKSKENLYEVQVKDIELASSKWELENKDLLDSYHINSVYLDLSVLQKEGFLESGKIENPKTGEDMNGCVEIKYNDNTSQYHEVYYDVTCEVLTSDSTLISEPHGYIRKYENKELVIKEVNPISPAAIDIVNQYKDNILYEGNTTQGLYDIGEEYRFRGADPRNYIKINGSNELWRVISINKKNYTMKLIKVGLLASNQWDSENKLVFENATIHSEILDQFMENNDTINNLKNKIESSTWNIGIVSDEDMSSNMLQSLESSNTLVNNVGLINISDYVLATTNKECSENFKSSSCATENYLASQFSGTTWTLNSNGSKIWTISSGSALLNEATSLFNIYPVIVVKPNLYIINESTETIGTNTNPYILR